MDFYLCLQLCVASAVYLVTFGVWHIQIESNKGLTDWLHFHHSQDILPELDRAGIWNVEAIAATSISSLPETILKDGQLLEMYQYLKDQACNKVMLPLWLRDKGLSSYAEITEYTDLVTLSRMYPGEIFRTIHSFQHLTAPERVTLRADVHNFKSAVAKFQNKKLVEVMAKKEEYAKMVVGWSYKYRWDLLKSLFQANGWHLVWKCLAFLCTSDFILWLALPHDRPLHGAYILPAMATYWIVPEWGRLNMALVLFLRCFREQTRMALVAGILHIWMLSVDDVCGSQYLLQFSILPTITVFVCINKLRCQPSMTKDPDSESIDLTLSGIGHADADLKRFYHTKTATWFYTTLADAKNFHDLDWGKLRRIKFEDVDVSWQTISQIIQPSLKSKSLAMIWIADNHTLMDADAKSMAKTVTQNPSLKTLRITYNRKPSSLDYLYRLLLWNQNGISFTNSGAMDILDAISNTECSHLTELDFCGINLKQSFVKKIIDTPKLKDVNILVNKKLVTDCKTSPEVFSNISDKMCLMATLSYATYSLYNIISPSAINILSNTWLTHAVTEIIYPYFKTFLNSYFPDYGYFPELLYTMSFLEKS